jgi:TatD DNase family protein
MVSLTFPDAHLHVFPDLGELASGSFVNATSEDDWQACLATAKEANGTAFIGVHPWFLNDATPGWEDRLANLAESQTIGIGEIGLDKYKGPPLEEQLECFSAQFKLAITHQRPVSLHCVKRWNALLETLRAHAPFESKVMVHGFSGSAELRKELTNLGCYLSFGFQLLDDQPKAVQAWVEVPEERILLETDAPSGLLRPGRASADYGVEVGRLLSVAADLRGVSPEDLVATLRRNALGFLGR